MELRRLQRLVIDALEDIKGQDIQVYNTTHLSDLFDRVILVTFFVASALAGMGGVLFGLRYASVDFFMGYLLGIKAFTAAVIGGIGNIRGAMVGGLLLGVLESLVGGFISSQFQDTFVFLALITVLLIRPQGLFGQPLTDRA